ncbi:hypothetical protein [Haliangium sp.]|uniref:hypothetical protein n=1 Tax=Haliangium sp. TaxID=2663208 RepID=UPI003D130810
MRFSLQQTSARSFDLSLPAPEGRVRDLGFEHITELGGTVELSPLEIALSKVSARLFQVSAVAWNTPTGVISVGAPVAVVEAEVDGRLPRGDARGLPIEGAVRIKRLATEELVLDGFIPRLSCGVQIDRLALEQSGARGEVEVEALAVTKLETSVGNYLLKVAGCDARALVARWVPAGAEARRAESGDPGLGLELDVATLKVAQATLRSRAISVQVEDLTVRELSVRGRTVTVGALSVGKISVDIDVAALTARREVEVTHEREPLPAWPLVDLRLLDRIDGQLDVDITVDATMPVIRRRRATHCFRVPVTQGVLDFRQIERGLSMLENAVIDFDVQEHKLVIERDLPIIRMRKNLVEWHLDEEEMALARRRLVRMRTLPRFHIVSSGSKNSDFKLHQLDLGHIDVVLSMPARVGGAQDASDGSAAEPGPAEQPLEGVLPEFAIGRLALSGTMHHPDGEGTLAFEAKSLATVLRGLLVGTTEIDVGALRAAALAPVSVTLKGVRPQQFSATLSTLELEQVVIAQARAAAPAPVHMAPAEPTATQTAPAKPAPASTDAGEDE